MKETTRREEGPLHVPSPPSTGSRSERSTRVRSHPLHGLDGAGRPDFTASSWVLPTGATSDASCTRSIRRATGSRAFSMTPLMAQGPMGSGLRERFRVAFVPFLESCGAVTIAACRDAGPPAGRDAPSAPLLRPPRHSLRHGVAPRRGAYGGWQACCSPPQSARVFWS